MRRLLLFVPVILAVVLGVVLFAGIGKDPSHLESALIGKPVPAFSLKELQNPDKQFDNQLLKGKVQLLNVWATWCPTCRAEHSMLIKISRQYGVPVIGLDYKDNRQDALAWLDELGNPYSVVLSDPEGKFGFDLGVYGAPETYVIDREGIVRFRHVGEVTPRVWQDTLEPLIQKYREAD